jgi:hypothetical protein
MKNTFFHMIERGTVAPEFKEVAEENGSLPER